MIGPARCLRGIVFSLVALVVGCGPSDDGAGPVGAELVGRWRAELASPGGPLPFGLEIERLGDRLEAFAVNGAERAPFSSVAIDGRRVVLAFDFYDSRIEAEVEPDGGRMRGEWTKVVPKGLSRLEFSAERAEGPRFAALAAAGFEPGAGGIFPPIDGVWEVEFSDDDGREPAQGEFRQRGSEVAGTFLTPTGDFRFLAGSYERGVLRLSTFDGAHAFLFTARATPAGTLAGDFWSRDSYHATWTARRAGEATPVLPDAWSLVGLTNDTGALDFRFPDLEGREVSLADPRFAGKVVLVNLFGSWCPNCNDEAPLLAEWARRYRQRGLEVVGLAYEFTGEPERDRRQVARYAERHGIDFPLLLAGVSDKKEAAATLPDLTGVVAYPTSIFVGRDGRVREIHSGFAGPGTGEHHERLKAELEALIERLLAEGPPAPVPA